MKKYIVTIIFLLVVIGLFIGGYFIYSNAKTNEGNSVDTLKAKCTSELEYLSSNIILMMNELNNISYENYKVINDEIKVENSGGGTSKTGGEAQSEGTRTE